MSSNQIYSKATLINGQPRTIECLDIYGQTFSINRGPFTTISLDDEWYDDIEKPDLIVSSLNKISGLNADLFSFWQRLPDIEPQYAYHQEQEDLAVISITSFDNWWNHQIKSRTRSLIRKSEKEGLIIKETEFDDSFIQGMVNIFNESPVRQGRRFWHYGKDFETIKNQFSRFLFREQMIGAYFNNELVGFMMLCNAGKYAITGQIISSLKHRDKSINNALVAKAVKICEDKKLPYLVYFFWTEDSLAEFKRRSGFQKVTVPRYYIPLSLKGKIALKLGLHRGFKALLPQFIIQPLKKIRKKINEYRMPKN